MQIIPVIDLKNGFVVHAKQGNRNDYAPLKSKLCKSADIFDVVDAFWSLFQSTVIYIADLDAITRSGNNTALLNSVLSAFPQIAFWVDGGFPLHNNGLPQLSNYLPVLGSESFQDETLFEIKKFKQSFILSLDYSVTGELGSKVRCFPSRSLWPENIIIMSLAKVGSNQGPDFG